ncbi:hypothetical protein M405DRAFT_56936 [Rhizopogon salebrosus TDB-379]|nr:hypothetical protein M405DRAFT_56936 [Rhizopogon salebrosus TDB-379]
MQARLMYCTYRFTIVMCNFAFIFMHHAHCFSCLCIIIPSARSQGSAKHPEKIAFTNPQLFFYFSYHCSLFIKHLKHIHAHFSSIFLFFIFSASCRTVLNPISDTL